MLICSLQTNDKASTAKLSNYPGRNQSFFHSPFVCRLSAAPPLVAGATTFLLKGSMSLDSQSPTAPYESSSFATPQAGAQQPVLYLELLMKKMFNGALLSHRTAGWQANLVRREAIAT